MGFITDILKDLPVSAVMREKILKLETDILKVKKEKAELEEQFAELKEKYLQTVREFEEYRASHEQFVEVKGMKFKRLDSGAYSEIPYCINFRCHNSPMSIIDDFGYALCSQCGYKVKISSEEVRHIAETLSIEK